MLQVGDGLDLAEEPLGADHGREVGAQDLDGDLALVAEVAREIDGGHAALAELALDAVAVGEDRAEALNGVGQAELSARDGRRVEAPCMKLGAVFGVG